MPEPRRRTEYGRQRARARFWTENGEKVRLVLIAAGTILVVSFMARMILG